VGQIVPITGPVSEKTAQQATQSYFNMVNANGGINGCQVHLISLDDGGLNQQQAAADARQLVQQDHVFAIVGNIEPVTGASTAAYFAENGVPVVGVDGVGLNEYGNPVEYSFAESPAGFGISTANYLHKLGFHRPAIFYLDFDFGHASFDAFKQTVAANGDTVVYSNSENVSSTSYPTDVLAARAANPDVVVNIVDANSAVREINAMQSNSWYPNMVATTSTSDPVVTQAEHDWFGNPAHQVYVQRNYYPPSYNNADVQQWLSTQGRYYPGFDPNSYAEGAWLGAKIFVDLAKQQSGALTRASLFSALNALSGYQTGFTVPITMTSDHGPNRSVLWMQWSNGGFQQISGFVPW
jgi:branched-chain amino acid transport system substrate-binding protein